MVRFEGFRTKAEAQEFIKKNGKGLLCYEKSETEKKGRYANHYRECVVFGGLSREYPYAVQWNI